MICMAGYRSHHFTRRFNHNGMLSIYFREHRPQTESLKNCVGYCIHFIRRLQIMILEKHVRTRYKRNTIQHRIIHQVSTTRNNSQSKTHETSFPIRRTDSRVNSQLKKKLKVQMLILEREEIIKIDSRRVETGKT